MKSGRLHHENAHMPQPLTPPSTTVQIPMFANDRTIQFDAEPRTSPSSKGSLG